VINRDADTLRVELEESGDELWAISRWSIDQDYWLSADGFEFSVTLREDQDARQLWMQPVTLKLGDVPLMAGRIEVVDSGDDGREVRCRGRDFIGDLIEGHVDPTYRLTEKTTLADAILRACKPYGVTKVSGDGNFPARNVRTGAPAGGSAPNSFQSVELKELQPKSNQGCWDFINRLAARNGATVQPGVRRGELSLAVPGYMQEPAYYLKRTRDPKRAGGNNIESGRAVRDGTHLPTFAEFRGNGVRGGANASKRDRVEYDCGTLVQAVSPSLYSEIGARMARGLITDSAAPSGQFYRLFTQRDDESKTFDQVELVAARAIGERLKSTLVYTATVSGFRDPRSELLWGVDTVVDVDDEPAFVKEPLWVTSRTFRYDSSGATTELELWRPGLILGGD
jgi:prophage tail gpP-like protein